VALLILGVHRIRCYSEKTQFQGYNTGQALIEPPADTICQIELSIFALPSDNPTNEGGRGNGRVKMDKMVALGEQARRTVSTMKAPESVDY
jgi:hypothetical protein